METTIVKKDNLLYEDLTYQIRGACFSVWKNFRGGFKESIVDKALSIELKNRNLNVEDQKRIDVYYSGEKVGTYIPDKIVDDKVLIEMKSKPYLCKEDERQFWKYLKASKYKVGMLVNFGSEKLEIKRRIYDKARENCTFRVNPRLDPRQSASIEKGFTLIELIVTLAIISILSTIILFSINQYISKGQDSNVAGNLAILVPAGETYYNGNNSSYQGFCSSNVAVNAFSQMPTNTVYYCSVASPLYQAWAACARKFNTPALAYCVDSRGVKKEIPVASCKITMETQCP